MKAENTPRERNNRSNNSFVSLCKRREVKKKPRSNAADALRDSLTSQRLRSLCTRAIDLSLLIYCDYVVLLQRAKDALVVQLDALLRCHGDPISFLLRVYQNAESRRVLCAFSKCTSSHVVLSILPRQMNRKSLWKGFIINILSINKKRVYIK